jgi:heme/copper-type cytochrome/quinol oxidase subunit 1
MLWLGYAGMPRRIQDYPWGYANWHSVASFGHSIVLLGVLTFIFTIIFAIYLKKAAVSRNKGLPFISYSVLFLNLDISEIKSHKNIWVNRRK